MSAEAVGWVFRHSPYKGATFAVHLAIADSVSDQHENRFWMGQTKLAMKARCARGAVIAAIQQMIADSLIELVEDRHAAGLPNEYLFHMPAVDVVFDSTLRAQRTRGARPADKPRAQNEQEPARSANNRTQVRTQPEPKTIAREQPQLGVEHAFDSFWREYPRKTGKPSAQRSWVKHSCSMHADAVMSGLAKWTRYWAERNQPEFIPHPATWLNDERWNDEPPAVMQRQQPKGPRWSPTADEEAAARARPTGRVTEL